MDQQTVRLTLQKPMFEYIVRVMVKQPYEDVAPTIAELVRQAQAPPAEVVPLQQVHPSSKEPTTP